MRCMVWKSFVGHDDVPCVHCGMEISMSFCVCAGGLGWGCSGGGRWEGLLHYSLREIRGGLPE